MALTFGVSTATISHALNGLPGVSEELRARILDYAHKNHYIPNTFGRGLKGIALKVIGIVISDLSNANYYSQIKGIESASDQFGYNNILCSSDDNWQIEMAKIKVLIEKNVDGMIIVPTEYPDKTVENELYQAIEASGIPFVLMNRLVNGKDYDIVKTDNYIGCEMAVNYLYQKNHRRIIHLTTEQNTSTVHDRTAGFINAIKKRNGQAPELDIYRCNKPTVDLAYEKMMLILKERQDFTAVFAYNDNVAFGAIKAILSIGKSVPNDISVMGYDDNAFSEISQVPLTTVKQDNLYIGKKSAETLIEKIEGRSKETVKIILNPEKIIERESVKALLTI